MARETEGCEWGEKERGVWVGRVIEGCEWARERGVSGARERERGECEWGERGV